jgi:serine O-acetyltransferase
MLMISRSDLSQYVTSQLENLFPDKKPVKNIVNENINKALERTEYCFSKISNKYYSKNGEVFFDYLHTDQYAAFLYFLSNTVWENNSDPCTATKIFALNKALHGLDVFYEVKLPDIFFFSHSVGAVLGRAKYSDYLVISQGVIVGGNKELVYPEIGEGTFLYSRSAIIGKSKIGSNNLISIGTIVRESNTPDNAIVFSRNGEISYKPLEWDVKSRYFK